MLLGFFSISDIGLTFDFWEPLGFVCKPLGLVKPKIKIDSCVLILFMLWFQGSTKCFKIQQVV